MLVVSSARAHPAAVGEIEPLTDKEFAEMKLMTPGPNDIFIWDGHAELIFHVSVVDSATQRPIVGAKVSAVRDRRVARHIGRSYKPIPARITDDRGRASLRGEFPAAGDGKGSCVFVLDSYVVAEAAGHVARRARMSPIYRLDFPRGRLRYHVSVRIALTPR